MKVRDNATFEAIHYEAGVNCHRVAGMLGDGPHECCDDCHGEPWWVDGPRTWMEDGDWLVVEDGGLERVWVLGGDEFARRFTEVPG